MSDVEDRPPIPAALQRRVLVEAGHRCAIPTCRCIQTELHHIVPWAKCHEHKYENFIALCPNCHARADRGEIDREALRMYKANLRYMHDKFSQFEVDMLFECYHALRTGRRGVPFVEYLLMLVKRLLDEKYIDVSASGMMFNLGGLNSSPVYLSITPTGIDYVNSLGKESQDYATD